MKVEILNIPIEKITLNEATVKLHKFLETDKHNIIITPNPEIVMLAQKDKELFKIINKADLVVADGIGLVIASRLLKNKLPERVAGADLVQTFLSTAKNGTTIYLLGSKDGVAKKAAQNINKKHKNISVVGYHSGYFSQNSEKLILDEIIKLKPNVVLVGLGAPKQEKWIYKHHKLLPCGFSIGVGGVIDIYAGVVKRAPILFIALNLEWFYRLLTNPKRIKRLGSIPIFFLKILFIKFLKILKN